YQNSNLVRFNHRLTFSSHKTASKKRLGILKSGQASEAPLVQLPESYFLPRKPGEESGKNIRIRLPTSPKTVRVKTLPPPIEKDQKTTLNLFKKGFLTLINFIAYSSDTKLYNCSHHVIDYAFCCIPYLILSLLS